MTWQIIMSYISLGLSCVALGITIGCIVSRH